ncbi:selenide, water dikinase [Rubrobacter xylanophilus]|uniref:Selenide, water dikinase n=2 Tax=Rubrobacter xylanophilus TaxID=49319 RepID=A0A510HGY2_9ACTN|nr:selenide, water dikinase [Rubrobacter xylanophilus]
MDTRDDAGYVPFGGGLLLQSVDFFPPIVDDPYRFGQIAAANALSDIYAMGGEPLTAMNLVGFPCSLDLGVLREILAGGLSKIEESGARLCGGHSVDDREPKYGLSVTGFATREKLVRNAGARPGDALILTKPLGFGILTTALKRDLLSEEEIEPAVKTAAALNRAARDAMLEAGPSAATDVTGYGLLGHLSEMLRASGAGAVVRRGAVPVWERAQHLAAEGCYPGGLKSNREYLRGSVLPDGVDETEMLPLYDPQTSGGLLISIPPERSDALLLALRDRGVRDAARIGEVTAGEGIRILP